MGIYHLGNYQTELTDTATASNGAAVADLQAEVDDLTQRTSVVIESVDLTIPANTWTAIPLPGSLSEAYDYRLFVGDDDITYSVASRKAQNSFEIISFIDLQTTVLIQGIA